MKNAAGSGKPSRREPSASGKNVSREFRPYGKANSLPIQTDNNRVSPGSALGLYSIYNLRYAWKAEGLMSVTGKALTVEDCMFFADWMGYASCVNKFSGQLVWKKRVYLTPDPKECEKSVCSVECSCICPPYRWQGFVGSGVIVGRIWYLASAGGKPGGAFYNGAPGKIYALSTQTGEMIWQNILDGSPFAGCLTSLQAWNGMIYVGLSSVEGAAGELARMVGESFVPSSQGAVMAFDAVTGRLVWKVRTMGLLPGDSPEAAGAGIISSFALDDKSGRLYLAVEENNGEKTSLCAGGLICLCGHTGRLIWHTSAKDDLSRARTPLTPFSGGVTLFETVNDYGYSLRAAGAGNSDGRYYCFHRDSGEVIWASEVLGEPDTPAPISGTASFRDGRLYLYANCGWLDSAEQAPEDFPLWAACLDAATGAVIWRVKGKAAAKASGLLCGDIYLIGDLAGEITAYSIYTGKLICSLRQANISVAGGLMSEGGFLYFGAGVPKISGGNPSNPGLYAYCLQ